MSTQLFANNASSYLAASINDTDLTIQVQSGQGALFPNPGAGEFFKVTLMNADGDVEIVKIQSRASDLLTVASGGRGQEGTEAQSWTNGQAIVECRVTADTLARAVQQDSGVVADNITFSGTVTFSGDQAGVDADTLQGNNAAFFRSASNLNAGTVAAARLSGTYTISVNGNADTCSLAANSTLLDGQNSSFYRDAGNLNAGTVANARLPNIGSMPGVTIQSDPGGTPSGAAGEMFFFY